MFFVYPNDDSDRTFLGTTRASRNVILGCRETIDLYIYFAHTHIQSDTISRDAVFVCSEKKVIEMMPCMLRRRTDNNMQQF